MPSRPFFILVIFLFCLAEARGQSGNYFLSHYSPGNERFDYVCFDMAQDDKGVMYFATKAGILEFNGRDWDLMAEVSAVYSLQIHSSGTIYWSGARGFGSIGVDQHGFRQAKILSDSTVTDVFQALVVKDRVYFLTEQEIFALAADGKITRIRPENAGESFFKLFELFGIPYVDTDYGIYKIDGDGLVSSTLDFPGEVVFSSRMDSNYLIGAGDNRVYSCNQDLEVKAVTLQDQAYLNASVIVGGAWLNRQLMAIGTLRGGVIFINPINGLTQEITNYSTGLPDNEVFKLMSDQNNNVWVSHDYGFSKISPYIPLNSFSHYHGLQGNLLCAYTFQNSVYVGTSLGLFKLEKVEVYDEIVTYVDVEVRPRRSPAKKSATPVSAEPKTEPVPVESKRGGLFAFLKKNKNKGANEDGTADAVVSPESSTADHQEPPRYRREKRVEKILRSAQYEFRKVAGIDAKITHISEVNGKLLASGLGGLFEVSNLTSKPVMEEPIRYIYAPGQNTILIVSTYNDDVRVLDFADRYVQNVSLFSGLHDQIHHAFVGPQNELWLCGVDKIYRAQLNNGEVRHKQSISLPVRNSGKTVGIALNGEIVLTVADGFYKLNRQKSSLEKLDTLPTPSQYFAHDNNILYRDVHGWNILGTLHGGDNLQLLNVFEDLRFLASETGRKNLWLISGGNELYKFYGDRLTPIVKEFPLFLKSISHQDKKVVKLQEIIMDQEHSAVKFEVVLPDYINPSAVEFRYMLEGMQAQWSEWSSDNNIIPFPYLPTGEYVLQVQARNIFGKISELEALSFEVLPPYWKRPWFYALEFAILASLVVLSFRLSTRYRLVSRLLSLLTIILLIEFIQTAIGATIVTEDSPVIDFIIQVVVAMLVLPVEGYLRNLMLRSLDSSGKFYQFIVPTKKATPIITKIPDKFIKETTDIDS